MVTFPVNGGEPFRSRVVEAVGRHPHIERVTLAGSRAEGRAHTLSDWDFTVETHNFASVAPDMPLLCMPLHPLAQQWDRLSRACCWMLLLAGPVKVDLIFAEPHAPESAWQPNAANLAAIDAHFWDWVLWLRGKQAHQQTALVAAELRKMFGHILEPMGISRRPTSIDDAIATYRHARAALERTFGSAVPRTIEQAVYPAVSERRSAAP